MKQINIMTITLMPGVMIICNFQCGLFSAGCCVSFLCSRITSVFEREKIMMLY